MSHDGDLVSSPRVSDAILDHSSSLDLSSTIRESSPTHLIDNYCDRLEEELFSNNFSSDDRNIGKTMRVPYEVALHHWQRTKQLGPEAFTEDIMTSESPIEKTDSHILTSNQLISSDRKSHQLLHVRVVNRMNLQTCIF